MARATTEFIEGGIEADNIAIRIAAGGRKEADRGVGIPGVLENRTIETKIIRLHREPASAHCDDVFSLHGGEKCLMIRAL
jgi:hypothetical protein